MAITSVLTAHTALVLVHSAQNGTDLSEKLCVRGFTEVLWVVQPRKQCATTANISEPLFVFGINCLFLPLLRSR